MADIIHLNQEEIKSQLSEMIKNSVEETTNSARWYKEGEC